jgi:hypothetical protein
MLRVTSVSVNVYVAPVEPAPWAGCWLMTVFQGPDEVCARYKRNAAVSSSVAVSHSTRMVPLV